jgi:hypothetical protein
MPENRNEEGGVVLQTRQVVVLKGDEKNGVLREQLVVQFRKKLGDFNTLQSRWNSKAKEELAELSSLVDRITRLG